MDFLATSPGPTPVLESGTSTHQGPTLVLESGTTTHKTSNSGSRCLLRVCQPPHRVPEAGDWAMVCWVAGAPFPPDHPWGRPSLGGLNLVGSTNPQMGGQKGPPSRLNLPGWHCLTQVLLPKRVAVLGTGGARSSAMKFSNR